MAITPAEIGFFLSGGTNNIDPSQSIGGEISSNPVTGVLNNLFVDINKEDAAAGVVDYRCIYIYNESPSYSSGKILYNAQIYLESELNSSSYVRIGISRKNELQRLSFSNPINNFTLIYAGSRTSNITYSTNKSVLARNIKNALSSLKNQNPSYDYIESPIRLSVEVSHVNEDTFDILFTESSGNKNHPIITNDENLGINITSIRKGSPVNSIAPKLVSSVYAPFETQFYSTNSNNVLSLGNLRGQDWVPIWIERTTQGSISADETAGFTIRLLGNTTDVNLNKPIISILDKPCFYYD